MTFSESIAMWNNLQKEGEILQKLSRKYQEITQGYTPEMLQSLQAEMKAINEMSIAGIQSMLQQFCDELKAISTIPIESITNAMTSTVKHVYFEVNASLGLQSSVEVDAIPSKEISETYAPLDAVLPVLETQIIRNANSEIESSDGSSDIQALPGKIRERKALSLGDLISLLSLIVTIIGICLSRLPDSQQTKMIERQEIIIEQNSTIIQNQEKMLDNWKDVGSIEEFLSHNSQDKVEEIVENLIDAGKQVAENIQLCCAQAPSEEDGVDFEKSNQSGDMESELSKVRE